MRSVYVRAGSTIIAFLYCVHSNTCNVARNDNSSIHIQAFKHGLGITYHYAASDLHAVNSRVCAHNFIQQHKCIVYGYYRGIRSAVSQ